MAATPVEESWQDGNGSMVNSHNFWSCDRMTAAFHPGTGMVSSGGVAVAAFVQRWILNSVIFVTLFVVRICIRPFTITNPYCIQLSFGLIWHHCFYSSAYFKI
jgi:hypothetical protein